MTKQQFNNLIKGLFKDMDEGYYGKTEIIDEIWTYFENEKLRNRELWKEVQKLRKKFTNIT